MAKENPFTYFRDLSLITRRGSYKTEGEAHEVLPLQKGRGGGKSFSHAEGGRGTTCFGVVFTRKLEVFAILKGGRIKFPLFKRGWDWAKSFTLS